MSSIVVSQHASVRMQQRGIPQTVVECLLENGSRQYDHRGGQLVYFDKRSWRRAERTGFRQQIANFDRFRRAYAVVVRGETVATVGHRYNRIRRH